MPVVIIKYWITSEIAADNPAIAGPYFIAIIAMKMKFKENFAYIKSNRHVYIDVMTLRAINSEQIASDFVLFNSLNGSVM